MAFFQNVPVYQAPGNAGWVWNRGDRDNCWVFSVQPYQANDPGVEVLEQWATTNNDLLQTTHFVVRHADHGLIRFTAMRLPE